MPLLLLLMFYVPRIVVLQLLTMFVIDVVVHADVVVDDVVVHVYLLF